jgi:predicted nucleic acid-binding protein
VAALSLVVLVLTIVAGLPALAMIAAIVGLVDTGVWIKLRVDRKRARESAENDKARLARQAKTIAEALRKCHTNHRSIAATATADREAILTVLA